MMIFENRKGLLLQYVHIETRSPQCLITIRWTENETDDISGRSPATLEEVGTLQAPDEAATW